MQILRSAASIASARWRDELDLRFLCFFAFIKAIKRMASAGFLI